MKLSLEKKIYTGYGLALLILLSIGTLSYLSIYNLRKTSDKGDKTYYLVSALDNIFFEVKNIQGGNRSYVLTGEDEYLEPYTRASQTILANIEKLRNYKPNDTEHQLMLDSLEALVKRRLEFAGEVINTFRTKGFDNARQLVLTDTGENLTGEISRIITELKEVELGLYKQYVDEEYLSSQQTVVAIFIGGGLAILFVFFSLLRVKYDFKRLKQAEDELRRSEGQLKIAQALGKIGSWEYDVSKQTIVWSDEVYVLYERDPSLGPPNADEEAKYYTPEQSQQLREYARRAIEKCENFEYDVVVHLPSGKTAFYAATMRPVTEPNGKVVKLFGTVQDITARKLLEQSLSESESRFRGTFKQAAVGIAHVDLDGRFLKLNDKFCQIVGYSQEEMLSRTFQEITHPDDLEMDLHQVNRLLQGEISSYNMEKRYFRKNRTTIWVNLTVSLIYKAKGEPDYFIAVVEDIEERKMLESKLVTLVKDLNRSNEELGQFAYVASHDLQEPLRMVSSFTQLLAERYKDKLDKDAHEFIHFAVDGANRMQRLINDLLDYSRVQRRLKEFEDIDSTVILAQAITNLNQKIEESKAIITNYNLPVIYCDESQITRLFQNLIDNAIKFRGDKAPLIHISAESILSGWKFAVKDNGIGIKSDYKEKIFEIFQRLHNNQKYTGTGIGLAICKKIVENHRGEIWVESAEGNLPAGKAGGTTFYFTISGKENKNGKENRI
jgi:PAS domain S-box-containing protein